MKKSLLAAAVLISVGGAAQAQMTLYGLIDASYGKSLGADLAGQKADFHSGGDNGSGEGNSTTRVGIKGTTDVGSGLKANFRFESNGITSDGRVNAPTLGRQAWFGLSGGFGELRLGRQDSVSFQTMIDFDFNGASNGVSAGGYAGVGPWLPGRQSRSLQYISPTLGGAMLQVGFVPTGNTPNDPLLGEAKNVFSVGGKFTMGPLVVGASAQTKDFENKKNFYSVGASYDLGFLKTSLSYADGGKATENGTGKGIVAGVVAPVAGFNIGGHYAINSDDALKIKSLEVFVNREVLKNTIVYAEIGNWKEDVGAKRDATGFAVGVIYVF